MHNGYDAQGIWQTIEQGMMLVRSWSASIYTLTVNCQYNIGIRACAMGFSTITPDPTICSVTGSFVRTRERMGSPSSSRRFKVERFILSSRT
jgi:hypothetical protein